MEEPVGVALEAIADSIGTSGEALRLLIGILGMAFLATSFSNSKAEWSRRIAGCWLGISRPLHLPTIRILCENWRSCSNHNDCWCLTRRYFSCCA